MLILSRKSGESITIQPGKGTDLSQPVGQFFHNHPVQVYVTNIDCVVVKLGIRTHRELNIVRDELLPKHQSIKHNAFNNVHNGRTCQILAVNLYNYRLNRRWSINNLSVLSNITANALAAMEQGVNWVNLDNLEVLARVYDVEVARLFKK